MLVRKLSCELGTTLTPSLPLSCLYVRVAERFHGPKKRSVMDVTVQSLARRESREQSSSSFFEYLLSRKERETRPGIFAEYSKSNLRFGYRQSLFPLTSCFKYLQSMRRVHESLTFLLSLHHSFLTLLFSSVRRYVCLSLFSLSFSLFFFSLD